MVKFKSCIDNYLSALLNESSDKEQVELLDQVVAFSNALLSNENIWVFLNSPLMSSEEKKGFIDNFSKKLKVGDKVINLFSLIISNQRLEILDELIQACHLLKDEINSVTKVEVLSSEEFSKDQTTTLVKKLESLGYQNIQISSRKDPSIMAGFKVVTKNKIYDLTLNSVISEFKEKVKRN